MIKFNRILLLAVHVEEMTYTRILTNFLYQHLTCSRHKYELDRLFFGRRFV